MRSCILFFTFFGLLYSFSGTRTFASSAPYWNWRNPVPQGNDYYAVTYGNGRFVAVGVAGTITTSTDGTTWSAGNSGLNTYLDSIAYGNGRFVVVGYNVPGALISDDGVSWTVPVCSVPNGWDMATSVTYAGDRFFAMSNNDFVATLNLNFVATSTDGVNWTRSVTASAANVGRIAFANGAYLGQDMSTGILSSTDGTTWPVIEAKMLSSTDGTTWVAGGGTGLAAISAGPVYFDGRWVVGGTLVTQAAGGPQKFYRALSTSKDGGLTWTVEWHDSVSWATGNATLGGLTVFSGRLYLLGDPNLPIVSTADFATIRVDMPARMIQLNAMAASADHIVAVGRYGQIIASVDGANWTSPTSNSVQGNLRAAAFGGGQWIVAGDSGLAASPDGITWRMLSAGASFNAGSIAYGNGCFVAAAIDGRIGVSTDQGTTWIESAKRAILSQVAFANGRFVGSKGLISSPDGITWSAEIPAPGGTGYWTGVFTVNDVFYAVGTTDPKQEKDGVIARSTDGLAWTTVATMSERLLSVGGTDGLIVACGEMGEVWTSADGLTWKRVPGNPLQSFGPAASLRWVGDSLIGATYYGNIVMSADGISWVKDEFASSGMMFGLAAGNGQVLAVGNGGVIWEVGAARFTRQPESRTVAVGSPVTFSVGATGKEPLSYQWMKDGSAISAADRKLLSTSAKRSPFDGGRSRTFTISAVRIGDAGNYSVVVTNGLGSATSSAAALIVGQPAIPPSITSQPESKTVAAGAQVAFSVVASGDAPLSYQWSKDNGAIVGATGPTYNIPAASAADNGTYTVVVQNSAGSVTSNGAALTVGEPVPPPAIMSQPESKTVTAGAAVTFTVVATGNTLLSYQWRKGNDPIAGATGSTYTIPAASAADIGTYTVIMWNSAGTVTSDGATLTVNASHLVNISTRAYCGTGNSVTIGGFVVTGSASKRVLVRAVGPSLTAFGIGQNEVLLDPTVEVHQGGPTLAANDNWGDNENSAVISSVAAQIGASALQNGDTRSSALLLTLAPGAYTCILKGRVDTSGIVLLEVYDADPNITNSIFVNISTRAYATSGSGAAIGGFVITGNAAKQVLLRAVGPTLTDLGVSQSDVLLDPMIELHQPNGVITSNDNWGENANAAAIVTVGARIGATAFSASDTKSSALLIMLQPGAYTFVVSGRNNTSGIVLLEVYDAD